MSKKKKLYTAKRWHCIPAYKVVGSSKVTFEERVKASKEILELGFITQEAYDKHIEELKKEYKIKD